MKFFKNRKLVIVICIILVAAVAVTLIIRRRAVKSTAAVTQQRTAVATKGTLSVTLSGSGSVSPVNRKEIVTAVDGVISENYLEEGKSFKAGDVLVKFDDSDAAISVKKMENDLKQKELGAGSLTVKNGDLEITAPISGVITEISVKNGDDVKNDSVLMTIANGNTMEATLIFENANTSQFKSSSLQIHIPDFMTSLTGKIQVLSQSGTNVIADVTVTNPGALTSGIVVYGEASTSAGSLTSDKGTLEFSTQQTVKAEVAGTAAGLSVQKDSKVTKGQKLMNITGEGLAYTVESEQLSLEQARVDYELAQEKLENYTIKAPFDGVAVSVSNLDPGDNVKAGTTIAILMDTSKMTFSVSIDELDISKVKLDQDVVVTADALEDQKIEGKVTAIAPEGTTSNGVTSYPVTVTIPGMENLKSGMNVDAVIQILNKENVLLVPVEALQKRGNSYMVWVKGASANTAAAGGSTAGANTDGSGSGFTPRQQNGGTSGAQPTEGTSGSQSSGGTSGAQPSGGTGFNRQYGGSGTGRQNSGTGSGTQYGSGSNRQYGSQGSTAAGAQSSARANRNTTANSYYNGASPVMVTVGDYNETYAEITEGLSEGDVVVLPALVASTSSSSNTANIQQGIGFGMPNMGGFTNGGGIPNGGTRSNSGRTQSGSSSQSGGSSQSGSGTQSGGSSQSGSGAPSGGSSRGN